MMKIQRTCSISISWNRNLCLLMSKSQWDVTLNVANHTILGLLNKIQLISNLMLTLSKWEHTLKNVTRKSSKESRPWIFIRCLHGSIFLRELPRVVALSKTISLLGWKCSDMLSVKRTKKASNTTSVLTFHVCLDLLTHKQ